jgi:hypothetical protein
MLPARLQILDRIPGLEVNQPDLIDEIIEVGRATRPLLLACSTHPATP